VTETTNHSYHVRRVGETETKKKRKYNYIDKSINQYFISSIELLICSVVQRAQVVIQC